MLSLSVVSCQLSVVSLVWLRNQEVFLGSWFLGSWFLVPHSSFLLSVQSVLCRACRSRFNVIYNQPGSGTESWTKGEWGKVADSTVSNIRFWDFVLVCDLKFVFWCFLYQLSVLSGHASEAKHRPGVYFGLTSEPGGVPGS